MATATPVYNDKVTAIILTWGVGAGGARAVTATANAGSFPCAVTPQVSGARGEGAGEGFDPALEAYVDAIAYKVQFSLPAVPPGLKPLDLLLWVDDAGTQRILTVTAFWPLGNATGSYLAKCTERT